MRGEQKQASCHTPIDFCRVAWVLCCSRIACTALLARLEDANLAGPPSIGWPRSLRSRGQPIDGGPARPASSSPASSAVHACLEQQRTHATRQKSMGVWHDAFFCSPRTSFFPLCFPVWPGGGHPLEFHGCGLRSRSQPRTSMGLAGKHTWPPPGASRCPPSVFRRILAPLGASSASKRCPVLSSASRRLLAPPGALAPLGAPPRPLAPPGASRRLRAPPGASRRLQPPPGASRRPRAPPGASRRLAAPSGASRRPLAPLAPPSQAVTTHREVL